MALWGQTTENEQFPETELAQPSWQQHSEDKESVIAPGLIVEGKIKGKGHVWIAGCFKGDIHVEGDVTVQQGAHITGNILAENIVVQGEVEGDIQATSRVGLTDFGVLNGDLKASLLTVATGSRIRGQVEIGGDERGDKVIPIRGGESSL